MIKIGRYTTALILIAVGGSLLLDHTLGTDFIVRLLKWWPVILIALGIEYLVISYLYRSTEIRMKPDIFGLLIALILSAIVIGMTHGQAFAANWLNFNPFTLADENGLKFEKETVQIPIDANTEQLELKNVNGNVVIRSGNVEQIEVQPTVYVSKLKQEEAADIADSSTIEYTEGKILRVTPKGESYRVFGLKHQPRINLEVILPQEREMNITIDLTNGSLDAEQLVVKNELNAHTTNGRIRVRDLSGNLKVESTNGSIHAEEIYGNIQLETVNGKISVSQIKGDAEMTAVNGFIQANHIEGDISAITTAGSVVVESDVHGDWDLATTAGSITVFVPENGDFTIDGNATIGGIHSEFAMSGSRGSIQGMIGTGEHQIDLSTKTGGISIKKLK